MNISFATSLQITATWIAFFVAITFHECAHALSAFWLGDDTAKRAGRLTLNPLVHIDIIGLICLIFFGIGWAKPVPMNSLNFRYPKLYAILCGLAGPAANFILALVFLYALKYVYLPLQHMEISVATFVQLLCRSGAQMNVLLGIFNLIPIPPLDGGHIVTALIPDSWRATYFRLMPLFVICILIIVSLPVSRIFLVTAMNKVLTLLSALVI